MKNDPPGPKQPPAPSDDSAGAAGVPAAREDAPPGGEQAPAEKLTPEEQMERFAQELKDKDWGHQPC